MPRRGNKYVVGGWMYDQAEQSVWKSLLTLSCLVVMIVVIDNDKVVNEIASV